MEVLDLAIFLIATAVVVELIYSWLRKRRLEKEDE